MRIIDADELKSLYSKEDLALRKRIFSLADRTPEVDVIPVEWIEKYYLRVGADADSPLNEWNRRMIEDWRHHAD